MVVPNAFRNLDGKVLTFEEVLWFDISSLVFRGTAVIVGFVALLFVSIVVTCVSLSCPVLSGLVVFSIFRRHRW